MPAIAGRSDEPPTHVQPGSLYPTCLLGADETPQIKCDLALPQCDWCFHRKKPCTFKQVSREGDGPASVPQSGAFKADEPVRTATSQASLGTSLALDASPSSCDTSYSRLPRTALPSGVHLGKLHFAGRDLGNISSHNGLPFFSECGKAWIRSCTGENAQFPALPRDLFLDVQVQPDDSDLSLPDIEVVEDYLRFFRGAHLKLEFPVVDSVMFQDTIRIAYGLVPDLAPHECMLAKACVFAFLSVLSLFEGERRQPSLRVDGDACALKARRLLSASAQDLGLTTLQTALMLVGVDQLY